jgi:CubicO group peptidase (beta-lactamase class C family)
MNTSATDTVAALDRLFEAACRSDQPGYVVGVAKDGAVLYRRAFGLASIEHAVANTPTTRMRIGSTTKQFTSLAVMLLAEDSTLELDAPLRRYLPELAGPIGEPTLRQLMNHMSGIRDPLDTTAFFLTEGLYPKLSIDTIYRWSQRYSRMNHRPGDRWIYSNMGYNLLSFAIERVSGQTLAAFMHDRIFVPLGMVDTALLPDDMRVVPELASFHTLSPAGGFNRGIYPCELLGGGGIVSTVDDMLRWMAHLRRPEIVGSPETWELFRTRPRFNSGVESDYCMGLMRQRHRGPELVHHAGGTLGCNCMMVTVPEHALDIIIMANRMDSDPMGLSIRIAEFILGDALLPRAPGAAAQGRESLPGRYLGTQSKLPVEIGAQGGRLSVSIAAGPAAPVIEKDTGLCADSLVGPVVLHIAASVTEKPASIELSNCGEREVFERLPEPLPAVESLAGDLVGHYRLADFDTPVAIVFEDQVLWIDLLSRYQATRLRLEPLSGDVLRLSSSLLGVPFTAIVVLERDISGAVSGFSMTSPRTWHLQFRRSAATST